LEALTGYLTYCGNGLKSCYKPEQAIETRSGCFHLPFSSRIE
jgi:hypothetical protein